jgi:hypothetical protein
MRSTTPILTQGDTIAMRMPLGEDDAALDVPFGTLLFDDGAQKGLGALIVWLGLIAIAPTFSGEDLASPYPLTLLRSLCHIDSMFKVKANSTNFENVIANIAKQDADARVQPVSSFQWACILKGLTCATFTVEETQFTLQQAMTAYNEHPDVVAYQNSSGDGTVGLALDNRKQLAIRNWFELCGKGAWTEAECSQHDLPFSGGPFSEVLSGYSFLFKGSQARGIVSDASSPLKPLEGEPTISIDYTLQLGDQGQHWLFQRIRHDFARATGVVPDHQKKRYRAPADALWLIRNMFALMEQIYPHLLTRLPKPEVDAMADKLATSSLTDDDLNQILEHTPPFFSLSMLASRRHAAQVESEEKESARCLDLDSKRVEVQAHKWEFFKEALLSDHANVARVARAPKLVAEKKHLKELAWRKSQSSNGEKAVNTYMSKNLKILDTVELSEITKEVQAYTRLAAGVLYVCMSANVHSVLTMLPYPIVDYII